MMKNLNSLLTNMVIISAGVLLLLFVFGVPYMTPLIIIFSLLLILWGVLKTNYHQTLLSQIRK